MKIIKKLLFLILFVLLCINYTNNQTHTIKYTAKNNYLDGNITVSNDYKLNNGIIYGINSNTTVSELKSKITANGTIEVTNSSGTPVNDNDIVKTGYKLQVSGSSDTYQLSVKGDVLSEGAPSVNGAKKIAKHILNGSEFTDNLFIYAADYDGDGYIKVNDITKMLKQKDNIITATFTVQDANAATSSTNTVSCTIRDGQTSCSITTPTLTAKSGYTVIGWNTNKDATEATTNSGGNTTISKDVTYYSITRSSTQYTATFNVDSTLGTASGTSASCYRYNGASDCEITAPTLTPKNSQYQAAGWSSKQNATTAEITSGGKKRITSNITYYSVIGKPITITFNKGTAYNSNYVNPGQYGYNEFLTNIVADRLEFDKKTCLMVNNQGCYIDDIPAIYVDDTSTNSKMTIGFFDKATSITENNAIKYPYILEKKFTNNATYYAHTIDSGISFGYTTIIGNIVVSFEEGIKANYTTRIISFLETLKTDEPALFKVKGQISYMKSATFNNFFRVNSDTSSGTVVGATLSEFYWTDIGVNYLDDMEEENAGVSEETIDNTRFYLNIYTTVHEMGHAFDQTYGIYTRNYDSNKVRNKSDLKALYNKYSPMALGSKPMGSYASSSIIEFWAESVANEYFSRYPDVYDAYIKYYNLSPTDKFQPITDDLKEIVKKYYCIAKHDFDEGANC